MILLHQKICLFGSSYTVIQYKGKHSVRVLSVRQRAVLIAVHKADGDVEKSKESLFVNLLENDLKIEESV